MEYKEDAGVDLRVFDVDYPRGEWLTAASAVVFWVSEIPTEGIL